MIFRWFFHEVTASSILQTTTLNQNTKSYLRKKNSVTIAVI